MEPKLLDILVCPLCKGPLLYKKAEKELICKPDAAKETTGVFKTAARARIEGEGRVIIANIGDQESDFDGGYSEKIFKLPNPFYLTH